MSSKSLRVLVFIFLAAVFAVAAFYSKDIQQKNPETLFLSDKESSEYAKYKKDNHVQEVLVAKILYNSTITANDIELFNKNVDDLKNTFASDYHFFDPSFSLRMQGMVVDDLKNFNNDFFKLSENESLSLIVTSPSESSGFKKVIHEIQQRFSKLEDVSSVSFLGTPYTNFLLDDYSKSIQDKLFPFMFGLSFILILLLVRSLLSSVVIFVPALASALMALSAIKLLYQDMNMITAVIPLICYVINLSLAFHIFYSASSLQSFRLALHEKWKPTVLMLLTTAIGFGSLALSHMSVIRQFGIMMIFIIILTSIYTTLWFFSLQSVIHKSKVNEGLSLKLQPLFEKSLNYKVSWMLLLVLPIGGLLLAKQIPILTDATQYFPEKTSYREQMLDIAKNNVGMPIIDLSFKSLDKERQSELIDKIQSVPELQGRYKILTKFKMEDFLMAIPPELSGHMTEAPLDSLLKLVSESTEQSRFVFLGTALNVDEYVRDLDLVKQELSKVGVTEYEFNGLYHQLMISQRDMVQTLIISFLSSLLCISLFAIFYLRSFYRFLIFTIINVSPLLAAILFVYLSGFSINIASIMTFSIAMGMVVDATFHIMHSLQHSKLNYNQYWQMTLLPILASSLIFIICFALFGFNDFLPIQQFGIILAVMLLLGAIADIFCLPSMLFKSSRLKEAMNEKAL